MKLQMPHFANTLLFRISATFLLLMGVSLGGYYFWIEKTAFNPYSNNEEQDWYENQADEELNELAVQLATNTGRQQDLMSKFGDRVRSYEVELVIFDLQGQYQLSTAPDSLAAAIPQMSIDLIREMFEDDWDYNSYPEPNIMDAYENRIFSVDEITDPISEEVIAYLVATYFPISTVSDDLNSDLAMITAQDNIFKVLTGLLIYSAVTALLIMAWTGRRVQRLSAGVEAFAAGDLTHRMHPRSSDELGTLSRNFNSMAERIESMVEKLRQKEQFQRQLIANVSHDLRTPMASVRGYVETLQIQGAEVDPAQQERYLKIITGNLNHLDRLIEHMLVLSRFDSGQAIFRLEKFPIAELADSILVRFEGLAAEKQVALKLVVDPDVALVRADPLQIAQVMQNLVENGIKFTPAGGRVTTELKSLGDRVSIAVTDTGCGIPAEHLPHIFDRFFTGNESRTRLMADPDGLGHGHHLGQSSGLGLAIASKIVAGHNSILRVESRLEQGTTLRFQLDCAQEGNADDDSQELVGDA